MSKLRTRAAIVAIFAAASSLHGQQRLPIPEPPPVRSSARGDTLVVAGAGYAASARRERWLGPGYRVLWTAALRAPVLDLARFGGGLTPIGTSGGARTPGLRFRAADGRQFGFRSVDKDVAQGLHPDFRNTLIHRVEQDQISADLPGAPLAASVIQRAAGVLHAVPQLVVLPDDARLGEHRARFAGALGTLEERLEDEPNVPRFAGAERIIGTETLFARLAEDSAQRVDAPAFLNARLVDLLLGDWDRHEDQWRWAGRRTADGGWLYEPIARDRDHAFVRHGGWYAALRRRVSPYHVPFDSALSDVSGLIEKAAPLDRRLLADLAPAVWDSVAAAIVSRVTDAVIDSAVGALPTAYVEQGGAALAARLRARRDALPAAAAEFRAQVSRVAGGRRARDSFTPLVPHADYSGDIGLVVGVGPRWSTRSRDTDSLLRRTTLRVEYAPRERDVAAQLLDERHGVAGGTLSTLIRASQFDGFRFNGYGNDSDELGRDRRFVRQDRLTVEPLWTRPSGRGLSLGAGPVFRFTEPRGTAAADGAWEVLDSVRAPGTDRFSQLGAQGVLELDRRDSRSVPQRGVRVVATATAFQGFGERTDGGFGRAHADASTYLPLPGGRGTTLALRTGGDLALGDYPVQEAAFLGGSRSLRGYSSQRFAGDIAAFGNAELRLPTARLNLGLVRANVGLLGLADAGRVWHDGDSPGGWHTAYGGGIFASLLDRGYAGTLLAATEPGSGKVRFYLKSGLPF